MAGPVQGSPKTKIIGTGFKPARSNVQVKWGVLSSDTIPKSSVDDYIYACGVPSGMAEPKYVASDKTSITIQW